MTRNWSFLVALVALSCCHFVASGAESGDPTGLRYDTAKTFAVELQAGAATGEASIREHAIAWHPAKRKYYLIADVVPLNNPHHPNTYDTDLHLWSSFDLAAWTYHGVAVPKGIPDKTYDGYGTCSPAAMTFFNGKLYVAFSAAKTRTYAGRSIGLAWSGDDLEQLPWTKTLQAISDLPGEDNDSGLVAIPGDDRLHLYHRTTGGYRIVHTASRTPEDPGSWPPAKDVTQRPEGVRAQELTGAVWADGAVHLFIIEHFEKGPMRIAHVQSRQPGAMFEPVDPRRRYVEPQPRNLAYSGHLTPVVRDERFVAFFWTVFQSGKRYGLLGHPTRNDSTPRAQAMSAAKPNAVRIAGIVLKWVRGDKELNFKRIEPMIREAAAGGARIVCTTECFLDGYAIADKSIPLETYRALGEPIPDGPYYQRLARLAKELNILLVAGMLEASGEHRHNTAVLIGPDGQLIGRYRKQFLEHESVRNTPGTVSPAHATPFGRVGVMICADRRDKEIVRRLCEGGADFLLCPSGGMFGPKSNDPILQARSQENKTHIVFVHPAEFLVTGPDGAILQRAVLGDKLLIPSQDIGGEKDLNKVFYFDCVLF